MPHGLGGDDVLILELAVDESPGTWLGEKMSLGESERERERSRVDWNRGHRDAMVAPEEKLKRQAMRQEALGGESELLSEFYRGVVSPAYADEVLGRGDVGGYEGGLWSGFMERFGDQVMEMSEVASGAMRRAMGGSDGSS